MKRNYTIQSRRKNVCRLVFIHSTYDERLNIVHQIEQNVVCCYNVLPIQLHNAYIGKRWSVHTVSGVRENHGHKNTSTWELNEILLFSLSLLFGLLFCLLAKRLSMFVICVGQSELRRVKEHMLYWVQCARDPCTLCSLFAMQRRTKM